MKRDMVAHCQPMVHLASGRWELKYFFACAFAAVLAGCTTSDMGAGQTVTVPGTPVADGWYPGERRFPPKAGSIPALNMPAYRQGTTPDGFTYTIYPDGSGGVKGPQHGPAGGWSIDCSRDAMTDRRECKLTSYSARLLVYYGYSANPESVCIIGHDFPGRTGAIRVDKAAPVTTDRDGCAPARVATQMASGSMVTTRRVEWPYDYHRDETASLAGAKSAMDLVSYIQSNVDKLTF
jgi:hypothetical protein